MLPRGVRSGDVCRLIRGGDLPAVKLDDKSCWRIGRCAPGAHLQHSASAALDDPQVGHATNPARRWVGCVEIVGARRAQLLTAQCRLAGQRQHPRAIGDPLNLFSAPTLDATESQLCTQTRSGGRYARGVSVPATMMLSDRVRRVQHGTSATA